MYFNKTLQYLVLRFKYPEYRDYLSMGCGIDSRYSRCKKWWEPHLRLSKEYVARAFCEFRQGAIAVFGSGRLLDVDLECLLESFDSVDLFDADPAAIRASQSLVSRRGLEKRVSCVHADLTGVMEYWTGELESYLKAGKKSKNQLDLAQFFSGLGPPKGGFDSLGLLSDYSAVISLNLLSQIPIYWGDRASSLLLKHWKLGVEEDGKYSSPLDDELIRSLGRLQRFHLDLLSASGARRVVLLTDQWFYYYEKSFSQWQVEPALFLEFPEVQDNRVCLQNFLQVDHESWLWHLAPQGVEQEEFGAIHEVHAYTYDTSR